MAQNKYPLQRHKKPKERLTPEEEEIKTLLKDYSDAPGIALLTDFTPTVVLYALYQEHVKGRESNELVTLTASQFGTVLTRLFPYLDEDRWKHVRRRVNGELLWGWIGLVGPASARVQTSAGRKAGYKKPAPAKIHAKFNGVPFTYDQDMAGDPA